MHTITGVTREIRKNTPCRIISVHLAHNCSFLLLRRKVVFPSYHHDPLPQHLLQSDDKVVCPSTQGGIMGRNQNQPLPIQENFRSSVPKLKPQSINLYNLFPPWKAFFISSEHMCSPFCFRCVSDYPLDVYIPLFTLTPLGFQCISNLLSNVCFTSVYYYSLVNLNCFSNV